MARIILDTRGVNIDGFEPIEPGVYTATIDTRKADTVKKKFDDQVLTFGFVIKGGKYNGRLVWEDFAITGDFRWKTAQLLKAVGIEVQKNSENGAIIDTAQLHGKEVRINVTKVAGKNGGEFNNVRQVMPPEDPSVNEGSSQDSVNF